MNENIGLGTVSQCVSNHPYIVSEGLHSSYVSGNIILEQMSFYKFKLRLNLILDELNSKVATNFWDSYGLVQGKRSVIEDAIQKGFCLDYAKLNEDCDKFFNGENDNFAENIETLRQLSEIKLAESRLLGMFESEIKEEQAQGNVCILQAITSTTDFIYSMYDSGLPQYCELMRSLVADHFFYHEEKGLLKTKYVEVSKDEALTAYLTMPTELLNSMILLADECKIDVETVKELLDNIDEFVAQLHESNNEYALAYKEAVSAVCNENQTYEMSAKKIDDYSIQ